MNRILQYVSAALCFLILAFPLMAKENIGTSGLTPGQAQGKTEEDCNQATAFTELNVNNVRAGLLNGGDIWWDLNGPKYEVPKVDPESGEPSRHSLFAGALWIGGIDNLGQLKVAAQTYRQTGNDFFPGPLDENGQVDQSVCANYDKFFEVRGSDVDLLVAALEANGGLVSPADVPESILKWPGRDNPYFSEFALPPGKNLAPYWESGVSDGYDPTTGDLPVIDSRISEPVYADQMIWWIFNDKGNAHSESGGAAIGLEIRAMSFAFATNDCINDMSFYRYVVSNTSTAVLDSVYFGQWVDPDLGEYADDYVGCVVDESLGIVYNGDAFDEGTTGYGSDIPMLGVDFFEGPKVDKNGDGDFLDDGEELGMSAFVYYNNDFTPTGNPVTADHYYGYLAGVWKDKSLFTTGGNAYQTGGEPTNYMFPSDPSEPPGEGVWSECAEGNTPADRRFLQVSGPFELEPGAINNVIVGVVWVRDGVQHPCPSFESLIECDQKAQALFDNNFKTLRGPDAPTMCLRELDKELILSIFNESTSNNFNEEYEEADPVLRTQGIVDSTYKFQGYRIFQLSTPSISPAQYSDIDVAREIFTVDIANDEVETLINWFPATGLGTDVPVVEVMGSDGGIRHTFNVKEDQFALGDKKLINHKRYYFSVVAYAYNNYNDYDPLAPDSGQKFPYLAGAKNIQVYTAIPHIPSPQSGGIALNSEYGMGPDVTQISGQGNGGFELELTDETVQTILDNSGTPTPVYKGGQSPIKVQVYDPFLVPNETFVLRLNDQIFSITKQPQNGTVSINGDGTIDYTPNNGFTGYDYFIYELTDANGITDQGVVRIEVGEISLWADIFALPLSVNDNDDVITIDVSPGIKTNPALPWNLSEVGNCFNGTVSIISESEIDYTPDEGFLGYDFFEYFVENEAGNTSSNTVHVFVRRNSRDPEVQDDDFTVAASGGSGLAPLDNDQILCDIAADLLCTNTEDINSSVLSKQSNWTLTAESTGVVYRSNTTIELADEQAIGGWVYDASCVSTATVNCDEVARPLGFTVTVNQVDKPFKNPAFIRSEFESDDALWLQPILDQDGEFRQDDWIMSGVGGEDYSYDLDQLYENVGDGGVAPYCLTRRTGVKAENAITVNNVVLPMQPACSDCGGDPPNNINNLHSVDLVITPDKSKWSQCVVIEMNKYDTNVNKGSLRSSASLTIDGNPVANETGRSYFPGYAINLETGKRMNIMFSENSRLAGENGTDMMFNPTNRVSTEQQPGGINGFRMGGEHYIYIMDSTYDGGGNYHSQLAAGNKKEVYDEALWVVAPLLAEGLEADETYTTMAEGLVPSELKVKIRMALPYEETAVNTSPEYRFSTGKFAPVTNDVEAAKSALDLVNVVPNPYYAYSQYENTKFDNTIKITNLPDRANINIYTLDGTWVNSLSIDNSGSGQGTSLSKDSGTIENTISWDIRNWKNIPVASGMYLIHVEAPDLGEEKVLKWFGVMRPIDLDNF